MIQTGWVSRRPRLASRLISDSCFASGLCAQGRNQDFWLGTGTDDDVKALARPLTEPEKNLLTVLLRYAYPQFCAPEKLDAYRVINMDDGGMGGLEFLPGRPERKMLEQIAEGSYLDVDGIHVSVTVNLDQEGELFELDSWKVNNDQLIRVPGGSEVPITLKLGQLPNGDWISRVV